MLVYLAAWWHSRWLPLKSTYESRALIVNPDRHCGCFFESAIHTLGGKEEPRKFELFLISKTIENLLSSLWVYRNQNSISSLSVVHLRCLVKR